MRSKWPEISLGTFMKERKEFVTIDDLSLYKRARNQWYGKGIVIRDEVLGSEIKTKQQQIVRENEFVVAEIDAKEGSFGVVPPNLEGAIVSSHYFIFQVDEQFCLCSWLDLLCKADYFRSQVIAQGSTNYSAVRPSQILNFSIPLPPLDEQRRIVARIEALASRLAEAQRLRREAVEEANSLMRVVSKGIFSESIDWPVNMLDEVAPINMGQSPPGDSYNFNKEGAPLLNGPTEFGLTHPAPRQWTTKPTKFCQSGDILICVRGATTGRMNWADQRYCIGRGLAALTVNTEKCVPEYVYFFVQTQTQELLARTAGSTFPNLPGEKLKALPIPVPSLADQHRIVSYLDILQDQIRKILLMQTETQLGLDAFLPSILDRAFKGEL